MAWHSDAFCVKKEVIPHIITSVRHNNLQEKSNLPNAREIFDIHLIQNIFFSFVFFLLFSEVQIYK